MIEATTSRDRWALFLDDPKLGEIPEINNEGSPHWFTTGTEREAVLILVERLEGQLRKVRSGKLDIHGIQSFSRLRSIGKRVF